MAIPMPGPYETPGVIQEILKRRREESRQAMLDKLNEEQIRASMYTQRQQLDISRGNLDVNKAAEQRAGLMDEAQRREIAERIAASQIDSMGDVEREITPEWRGSNPDLYKELQRRQRISTDTITPKAGSSYEAQLPEGATQEQIEAFARAMEGSGSVELGAAGPTEQREMFTGSPEFQRGEFARRRALDWAGSRKPEDPLRQALEAQVAGLEGVTPRDVTPRNIRGFFGGREVFNQPAGPYDDVVNLGQDYQLSAGNAPQIRQEMEPGTGRVVTSHVVTPDTLDRINAEVTARGNILVQTTAPFSPGQAQNRAKDIAGQEYVNAWRIPDRSRRVATLGPAATQLINQTNVSDPQLKQELHGLPAFIEQQVEKRGELPFDMDQQILRLIQDQFPNMSPQDLNEVVETVQMLLRPVPRRPAPSVSPAAPAPAQRPVAPIMQRYND